MMFRHRLQSLALGLGLSSLLLASAWAQVQSEPQSSIPFGSDTGWVQNDGSAPAVIASFTVEVPGASWIRMFFDETTLSGDVLQGTGSFIRMTS
ncbi:MAG: hypothetical protein ACI89E_002024, partial [Planctomycetota bacterium]